MGRNNGGTGGLAADAAAAVCRLADAAAARRAARSQRRNRAPAAAMAIGSPSPPAGEIASLDDAGPEHRAEVEGNLQQQQTPCTPKVIPNLTFPQYIPPILFYFLD